MHQGMFVYQCFLGKVKMASFKGKGSMLSKRVRRPQFSFPQQLRVNHLKGSAGRVTPPPRENLPFLCWC